jgi:phage-related protein
MAIKLVIKGQSADVCVYVNPRGRALALDFIDNIDNIDRPKIVRLLKDFADRGEIQNTEKFRAEKKPIFAFKSYQYRILCFYLPKAKKKTIILTHGFTKKQNRMPQSELMSAQKIYNEVVR